MPYLKQGDRWHLRRRRWKAVPSVGNLRMSAALFMGIAWEQTVCPDERIAEWDGTVWIPDLQASCFEELLWHSSVKDSGISVQVEGRHFTLLITGELPALTCLSAASSSAQDEGPGGHFHVICRGSHSFTQPRIHSFPFIYSLIRSSLIHSLSLIHSSTYSHSLIHSHWLTARHSPSAVFLHWWLCSSVANAKDVPFLHSRTAASALCWTLSVYPHINSVSLIHSFTHSHLLILINSLIHSSLLTHWLTHSLSLTHHTLIHL